MPHSTSTPIKNTDIACIYAADLKILQGHQQRTFAQILSVIQTQRCIFHSQRDFVNLLMISMPACLAHLKPSMAVIIYCMCTSVARWLSPKPAISRHEKMLDPAKNKVTNFQLKSA